MMENGFLVTCKRDVLKRAIWEVGPSKKNWPLYFQIKNRRLSLVFNGKSVEIMCELQQGGNDCFIGVSYQTALKVSRTIVAEIITVEFDGTDLKIDNTVINFDKGKKRKRQI